MPEFRLSPNEWTQVVEPDGVDDVVIRSLVGSCLVSLGTAHEKGAVTLVAPPAPFTGKAFTRQQVAADIRVYAKAISGPSIVNVEAIAG